MSVLSLSLLGPLRIERDGGLVHISRHKAVALLAYLAVTGQTHRRDALSTLLWPEQDQSHARAGLRRALAALKEALGEGWLDADRESVGLNRDVEIELDVRAFRERLAGGQGHGHAAQEVCDACLPLLAEAADLYGGDFLAGFTLRDSPGFDDWQFFQTQGLRDELASALERLVQGHSARGELQRAIAYARRWLALDPLQEPAYRWLMQLYAWSGQRVTALRQYAECERVLQEELGAAPEESTVELYRAIAEHREAPSPVERDSVPSSAEVAIPRKHNLPAQLIPFVGREALLDEIGARLADPGCRLLTLVGPGGSGKTRLALEAAGRMLDHYPNGIFFVPLAPLRAVESIVPTIAQSLGLAFHGEGTQQDQLIGYLRGKHLLLILDNCEHLIEGAGLVTDILAAAPQVKVCATSRVRLNVSGEQLHSIPGMEVPYPQASSALTPQAAARYSALKLFVASARRVRPGFALREDNLADVVRVCQVVEGMPLGILLAAAWLEMLTPAEIADEVERSLDFLETHWRDVPVRQRSMRAVFDHSWSLLGGREREILAGLSVFRGGFARGAAERVADASLRELMAMVNRSLVHRTADGRYEVHELLRQYAAEKLAAVPEVERKTRDRHCAFYADAMQGWDRELKGPRQLTALSEIEADLGNARAAWDWAVERKDVAHLNQAMDGLCRFYEWRGRYEEGDAACGEAIAVLDIQPDVAHSSFADDVLRLWAKAVAWRGTFHRVLCRLEQAKQLLEESLAQLEELASTTSQEICQEKAFALWQIGYTLCDLGVEEEGRQRYEQSLALYRALGERWGIASVLCRLAALLQITGSLDQAQSSVRESLAIRQALGDHRGIAGSLRVLGIIALQTGRVEDGERLTRESVTAFRAPGDLVLAAEALLNSGQALTYLGDLSEARSRVAESVAIYRDLGFSGSGSSVALGGLGWTDMWIGRYEQARASAQAALDLAREQEHSLGIGSALMLLGCLAIAAGEYARGQQLLRQACSKLEGQITHQWAIVSLGYAARGLGQPGQAHRHLREALSAVIEGRADFPVKVLPPIALLLADRGETKRAVELYALACRYRLVANSRWFEDVAGRHIAAVAAALPPDIVSAAQERGRGRDLWATVEELLAELEVDSPYPNSNQRS